MPKQWERMVYKTLLLKCNRTVNYNIKLRVDCKTLRISNMRSTLFFLFPCLSLSFFLNQTNLGVFVVASLLRFHFQIIKINESKRFNPSSWQMALQFSLFNSDSVFEFLCQRKKNFETKQRRKAYQ